jgi:hypothetical protein
MAGALGAMILVAVGVWWTSRPHKLRFDPPGIPSAVPSAVAEEMPRDVDRLRVDVVALARELDDLRRRAELMDARKDVDALMARLAPPGGSSGL